MAPSNPRPTDAELEALMARFGVRERIRQPEVQASLLRILARSKGIPVPPQPVVVKKP
jgi:MoxR-like ATPase